MEPSLMKLKILLPYKVFSENTQVRRIVAETKNGSYGFLPQRLDCVAALVPGIFEYETETQGVVYIAIDEGILIKTGNDVLVSVRNAIGGTDLGKLHELVEKEFLYVDEKEKNINKVMEKMSNSLINSLKKFLKE
ncbi:MAG TPA: F0F1 ATP synthase subunit epsilon [Bacteroidales bacterium]|nr:F0F1 ATP synthase subunit epsilon [Bacteroidales bacterium]HPS17188.1 F0F1 ATP synthase subunit epsilon [Bacteroidales bacterium]